FSPARNARSSTAPLRAFFSFVRTKATPLPGFTCWNSTTVIRPSGRSSAIPFFRSLVEMLMFLAHGARGAGPLRPVHCSAGDPPRDVHSQNEILAGQRQGLGAGRTDHDG